MQPSRASVFSPASTSVPLIGGFALLLCFMTMQSIINSRMPNAPAGFGLLTAERLAEAATFLAVALAAMRRDGSASLHGRRALLWTCGAACTTIGLLELAAVLAGDGARLYVSARLLWCTAGALFPSILWMAWVELYAHMDMRHVMSYYLLANVAQAVLTLLLGSVDPTDPAVVAAVAALPLASTALLRRSSIREAQSPLAQGEPVPAPFRFPAVPVALMAVFSFANVFARDVLPAEDRVYATVGVIACLVMLCIALRLGNVRFGVWPLCGAAFPLTLAGLFGLLLDGRTWGIAATLCTHAGEALFTVFIGVVLCNLAFRYGASALVLFGFTQAARSLASLAAALLAFSTPVWEGGDLTLVVAATGLALAVCYVALTRSQGELTWGVDTHEPAGETLAAVTASNADGSGGSPAAPCQTIPPRTRSALENCCSLIAFECGLTRREEEVLLLLAQDFTASDIERTLCVSNSTVKSHTHAVYQKLGVHSRAELVGFVQNLLGRRR